MLWHPSDQEAALCLGWSVRFNVQVLTADPPQHLHMCFMVYMHCSMSTPPFFVYVFRQRWTVHVVNAGCGLDPGGRYNLSSSSGITDLCQAACPCLPVFSVTCADLHTCHLFVYVSACFTGWNSSPSSLSWAASWWWEARSCLLTVHISVQEKPSQSCVCSCGSVISGGAECGHTA